MKKIYRMYLILNMDTYNLDILDNAVIVATCLTEAQNIVNNEWPELNNIEIIELDQNYLGRLVKYFPEEKVLCRNRIEL